MQSIVVSTLVFLCVFGGVLFGKYIRKVLPAEHLGQDTKEVIGLGMGLIGTLTALLRAMVTSTAKGSFDFEPEQIRQTGVNILVLDRALADYGPETRDIRESLLRSLESRLNLTWPEHEFRHAVLQSAATDSVPACLALQITQLTPQSEMQRGLQAQALQLVGEFVKTRWTLMAKLAATIPGPFLAEVVCWLTLIFASFGLFTPPNATASAALLVCALSLAGCMFLIYELDSPFSGLMKVSDAPLRFALSHSWATRVIG